MSANRNKVTTDTNVEESDDRNPVNVSANETVTAREFEATDFETGDISICGEDHYEMQRGVICGTLWLE